jgi:hypothetical protein
MLEQVERERSSLDVHPQCRQWTPPAKKPLPSLKTLVARMSHDLRTPLAAILANAEFLAMSNLNEVERDELYGEIRTSIERMSELLSDLLESSKGGEVLRPAIGNIVESTQRVIPANHHYLSPRRVAHWVVQLQALGTCTIEHCLECMRGGISRLGPSGHHHTGRSGMSTN